jgi:hypothetical protein
VKGRCGSPSIHVRSIPGIVNGWPPASRLGIGEKNHLLVAEAARSLGVSEKAIRHWHHADLIELTQLTGSLRIDRKSLLGLIDTNEREQDKDAQVTLQGS